jgi:hypothetical protein
MKISLPQMIDKYAAALVKYELAKAEGKDKEEIIRLKRMVQLSGWDLRDLGLNVEFDETNGA